MQSTTDIANNFNFTEVPVENTSYSKLVVDGKVAVLVHDNYGGGWSTEHSHIDILNKRMIFDSKIVLYVLSEEFKIFFGSRKKYSDEAIRKYHQLIEPIFQEHRCPLHPHKIDTFACLQVEFIPQDTLFRIKQYDGMESVEILDHAKYIRA